MSERKTISKKASKSGIVFALVSDEVTFEVWKLCENYDGKCKGGKRATWRYVEKNMSRDAAEALFNRRTA